MKHYESLLWLKQKKKKNKKMSLQLVFKIYNTWKKHKQINFLTDLDTNASGSLVACQPCQQILSYPLSFSPLC